MKVFGKDRHKPSGDWVGTTMVIPVVGIQHRRASAIEWAKAVENAEKCALPYSVKLLPDPANIYDANAIIVIGTCVVPRLFRSNTYKEWQIGFLSAEDAAELTTDLVKNNIPIAAELYSIFLSKEDFLDVKIIVLAPPGFGHKARLRMKRPTYEDVDVKTLPITRNTACSEIIEITEALKKAGRTTDAMLVIERLIDAKGLSTENGAAPGAVLQLAKLYRSQKFRQAELTLLEAFAAGTPPNGSTTAEIIARLAKLKATEG